MFAIASACIAAPARAQDTASTVRCGWIVGALVGVPGAQGEVEPALFTLGVGATRLEPNRPGVDLAVGMLPRALEAGVIGIGARLGGGVPVALSRDAFVIPSAGLTAVGAVGAGGGGGMAGFYWGVATVLAAGSVGGRAGVTWHRPFGEGSSIYLIELGLMHVPLPRLYARR
jgi:hypothetical protein